MGRDSVSASSIRVNRRVLSILAEEFSRRCRYSVTGGSSSSLPMSGAAIPSRRCGTRERGDAHIVLVDNPAHHPDGDFGLAPDGKVIETGRNRLTFSGIGRYHPRLFAARSRERFPLVAVLREAIEARILTGEHYGGEWIDVGTPDRLEMLDCRFRAARPG